MLNRFIQNYHERERYGHIAKAFKACNKRGQIYWLKLHSDISTFNFSRQNTCFFTRSLAQDLELKVSQFSATF